ncbi:hypothetical protein PVK06_011259 [Gossypium arboreum]|uniref:Uncharacterized protein n=1 Tax=Gossypium arboreum TaxID=29729 RepID=A0ABR0Q983_GOSAR|nr:hypothetical protein PVK06_011259 [Gossypium arboreum]
MHDFGCVAAEIRSKLDDLKSKFEKESDFCLVLNCYYFRVIEAAISVDCCFHFTVLMVAGDVSVMPDVSVDLVTNAVEGIEGAAEDSISSSWKSQGLALLEVERYLILHSMVIHLS